MTILAVVGLTAAIIIVTTADETSKELKERFSKLREENAQLQTELDARDAKIDTLEEMNAQLQHSLDTLSSRIDSLLEVVGDLHRIIIGASPCLGTQGSKPKMLLRIVVNNGYRLEPRWLPEDRDKVTKIPSLLEAVSTGQLNSEAFERHASEIYHHGDAEDTFGGSCRFFVELDKDTDSYPRFAQAVGVVNRYFLIANSWDVNSLLAAGE